MNKYKCSKCKNFLPETELVKYSKTPKKGGGFYQYYRCNPCNTEKMREYYKTEEGRKKVSQAVYRSVDKLRNKQNARSLLNWYLKKGKISKVQCYCGNKKTEAHHPDYSKPLEVIWLCRKHHSLLHREMR